MRVHMRRQWHSRTGLYDLVNDTILPIFSKTTRNSFLEITA